MRQLRAAEDAPTCSFHQQEESLIQGAVQGFGVLLVVSLSDTWGWLEGAAALLARSLDLIPQYLHRQIRLHLDRCRVYHEVMARCHLHGLITSAGRWQETAQDTSSMLSIGGRVVRTLVNSAGISCLYLLNRCSFNAW